MSHAAVRTAAAALLLLAATVAGEGAAQARQRPLALHLESGWILTDHSGMHARVGFEASPHRVLGFETSLAADLRYDASGRPLATITGGAGVRLRLWDRKPCGSGEIGCYVASFIADSLWVEGQALLAHRDRDLTATGLGGAAGGSALGLPGDGTRLGYGVAVGGQGGMGHVGWFLRWEQFNTPGQRIDAQLIFGFTARVDFLDFAAPRAR